jgi:hypothetical protein
MAPPLIALLFLLLIAAVVVGGGLVAIRTGLWVRETKPVDDVKDAAGRPVGEEHRPEHVEVDDPGKQHYVGT